MDIDFALRLVAFGVVLGLFLSGFIDRLVRRNRGRRAQFFNNKSAGMGLDSAYKLTETIAAGKLPPQET